MKRFLYFAAVGVASGVAACFTTGFAMAMLEKIPTRQKAAQRTGEVMHGLEFGQSRYNPRRWSA